MTTNTSTRRVHYVPKIGIQSLGCPKNLVDAQRLISVLKAKGYKIETDFSKADVVIINTCGFIEPAVEESFDAIFEAKQSCSKVIVMGCLGAQKERVLEEYPDVSAIIGPGKRASVLRAVERLVGEPPAISKQSVPSSGVLLTPGHYAYLKVAEGCRHSCSFCIIPDLRGGLRSRPIESIMAEAQDLVTRNVREIMIIAQDSSDYGFDLKDGSNLITLCEKLGQLHPRPWLRLHYVYPSKIVDELIPLMKDGIIVPYLDVPLQHASPKILKLMKRPGNIERTLERIQSWREICPDLTIRSNFVVGFPGETDEDFALLMDFIQKAKLDRVGTFPYSDVEGAQANDFDGVVDVDTRYERAEILMKCQEEISRKKLEERVGKSLEMLVDSVNDDGSIIARTKYEAPDIDGVAVVDNAKKIQVKEGDLITAYITKTDQHDMYATLQDNITPNTHIPFRVLKINN